MEKLINQLFFIVCLTILTNVFAANISGDLKKWHPVEIHFQGPDADEMDNDPNPFLDYRLNVLFTSSNGKQYDVPGFFNGDGKGNGKGNIWTVRFTPDEEGIWTYTASFLKGKNIAVEIGNPKGKSVAFDGQTGTFNVLPTDQNSPGFLKWGRLEYAHGHYLKFVDGPYWIKGGTDSPEDLLSYVDFDNTPNPNYSFEPHIKDWKEGDPTWINGKGKGMIGLLNYLGSQHVNSIYFLAQNIGGDGKNVWPFAGEINPEGHENNDNTHYDISKLHQWNIVFSHAQKKEILLHFVLNEAEEMNKRELDDAGLGVERKLFYRELIARFAHHNALQWNLSEEYDLFLVLTPEQIKEYAQYIIDVDPYNHPVTVHNEGRDPDPNWLPFVGDKRFNTTSFQFYQTNAKWGERVEKWRRMTEMAGHPIPINLDEFMVLDENNQEQIRMEMLWPTYLSGGNLEYIFAPDLRGSQDFRKVEDTWEWTWYARNFMQENLPFWEMEPDDLAVVFGSKKLGGAQVFDKYGEVYAIYLPEGKQTGMLTLWRVKGTFTHQWFNPRTGQFEGEKTQFVAEEQPDGTYPLGFPPTDSEKDWVILIKRKDVE